MPSKIEDFLPDSAKKGWLTTGPSVQKFEKLLTEYTGAEFIVAVNSCTAALHLALAAKGFGDGDKFIVPTYTFVASVEVGEYLGMEPILVDCDSSYNFDINLIEDIMKKEKNVKAIIPVHFAGKPVDMKKIIEIADKYNLFILEDAAHALESISNVGKVGFTDHAAAFSFYANKNITTAGEGGALATNDTDLAEKVRKLSLHGMSKDGWKRFTAKGKWHYDVSELGYKYNLTDVAASFGIYQFSYLKKWHSLRRKIFNRYQKFFKNIEGVICPQDSESNEKHAYHLYVIRIDENKWTISRDEIIAQLSDEGIGTSVHYKPIHLHSFYIKKYDYKADDFPNATYFFTNVISLPIYPLLEEKTISYICSTFMDIWKRFKS